MSDSQPNHQEESSYTPASFEKRTAAWMGIAYVLMMLFLITFYIYTGKGELTGEPIEKEFFGCGGVAKIPDLQNKLLRLARERGQAAEQ